MWLEEFSVWRRHTSQKLLYISLWLIQSLDLRGRFFRKVPSITDVPHGSKRWSNFPKPIIKFFHLRDRPREPIRLISKISGSGLHHFRPVRLRLVPLLGHLCMNQRLIVALYNFLSTTCSRSQQPQTRTRMWGFRPLRSDYLNWRVERQERFHIHTIRTRVPLIIPMQNTHL